MGYNRLVAKAKDNPKRRLALSDEDVGSLRARLRRAEGQVRAVERMVAERADCHDIVQQMSAVRAALDRAMVQLMVGSMANCLRPDNGVVDEAELRRLGETFTKLL